MALAWQSVLTIVLIAWGYYVASAAPSKQAWVWIGTSLVVVIGYLALTAVYVTDGLPDSVHTLVRVAGALVLTLAGVACLVLFAAVSHVATHAAGRDEAAPARLVDDEDVAEDEWRPGAVIDAGTLTDQGAVADVPAAPARPRRALPPED